MTKMYQKRLHKDLLVEILAFYRDPVDHVC